MIDQKSKILTRKLDLRVPDDESGTRNFGFSKAPSWVLQYHSWPENSK